MYVGDLPAPMVDEGLRRERDPRRRSTGTDRSIYAPNPRDYGLPPDHWERPASSDRGYCEIDRHGDDEED